MENLSFLIIQIKVKYVYTASMMLKQKIKSSSEIEAEFNKREAYYNFIDIHISKFLPSTNVSISKGFVDLIFSIQASKVLHVLATSSIKSIFFEWFIEINQIYENTISGLFRGRSGTVLPGYDSTLTVNSWL